MLEVFSKLSFFKFLRWDLKYAGRALVLSGVALAIAFALTAATDEGDVPWLVRLGRTWPVLPMCAAVGSWGALAGGRARMERIALETLGRSPRMNAAGCVVAGALVSSLAGLALGACSSIDLQGYYPNVSRGGDFVFDGHDFVDSDRGLRVGSDGAITSMPREDASPASGLSTPHASPLREGRARTIAASVTALSGIALVLLGARIQNATQRLQMQLGASVLAAVLLTILAFHAIAAESAPGWLTSIAAMLPTCALLAYAVAQYAANPGESVR